MQVLCRSQDGFWRVSPAQNPSKGGRIRLPIPFIPFRDRGMDLSPANSITDYHLAFPRTEAWCAPGIRIQSVSSTGLRHHHLNFREYSNTAPDQRMGSCENGPGRDWTDRIKLHLQMLVLPTSPRFTQGEPGNSCLDPRVLDKQKQSRFPFVQVSAPSHRSRTSNANGNPSLKRHWPSAAPSPHRDSVKLFSCFWWLHGERGCCHPIRCRAWRR